MQQRTGPSLRRTDPGIDLVRSKLAPPRLRTGTVSRSALLSRLDLDDAHDVVLVVAPPGYGKTTVLSQWAADPSRAVAWLSLDERDNDETVLLSYLAAALDGIQPVAGVFEALAWPGRPVPGSVVPELESALAAMTVPVTLIVDDVHLLRDVAALDTLSVLADRLPSRWRLVLAGRAEPPLPLARLRAEGRVLQIGPADLALDHQEAAELLRAAGLSLAADQVAAFHERTEGWPVGLYLAALSIREGGTPETPATGFRGDDRFVSEYLESEVLARVTAGQRAFLTRTAVLEQMSGPLCRAVLQDPGAGEILAELAGSNLLLVPLDRRGQWYRCHHLFRDMLLAELERLEPGLVRVLRRRAATWCLDHGRPEEALEYFIAAEDIDAAASLAQRLWLPTYRQGRVATLQRWVRWLDERGEVARHPLILVLATILAATTGRAAEAERWADVVERRPDLTVAWPDDPATEGWVTAMRALLCRHGAKQMRSDADEAARSFAAAGLPAPPVVALCQGIARLLFADPDGGGRFFAEVRRADGDTVASGVLAAALSEQALLAMAQGRWDLAQARAAHAAAVLRKAGAEDTDVTPLVCAVQGRLAARRGDVRAARQHLIRAQRSRPLLTYALPHLAVQARIELARVHLALADAPGARTLMDEIDEILQRRPELGVLVDETLELEARIPAPRGPDAPEASSLTTAELRLLPMLATHLSFPEIGAELFLSPNTVKSQATSIYRKLNVSSRHQAVTRCRELGLLAG